MATASSCASCQIIKAIVFLGAFNWGLMGLGYFAGVNGNMVNVFMGAHPDWEYFIYICIGLAAIASASDVCPCKKK